MPICATCGDYYRFSRFHNDTSECEDCLGVLPDNDESYNELDIKMLVNPNR